METAQALAASVIEKLKSEVRSCPRCGLEVRHPLIERCPRCYSPLAKSASECPGCIHRIACPVARELLPSAR